MSCLYWATVLTISLANTAPDALDFGEKSAKSLLGNLDEALAPDKRPKGLTEEAALKQRKALESQAHTTVGWVAMTPQELRTSRGPLSAKASRPSRITLRSLTGWEVACWRSARWRSRPPHFIISRAPLRWPVLALCPTRSARNSTPI